MLTVLICTIHIVQNVVLTFRVIGNHLTFNRQKMSQIW